ncbi:MAG: CDP-diacylglycerol--glycerol-3-phosphate 3-phosphatidyltransferase [Elusimicrobia bacterium]|nr:CDP-diacylglycerol--glycerol-3-phosphate 3-phosphatidyltransferase [Elusimicrobiota bacterium]
MNLANQLTMARIIMALAMVLALIHPSPGWHVAALGLCAAALVTDWVDGYVARKTNTISAFGKIADPIADKILVLGALIALLQRRELGVPAWGVFLIVARDLLLGGVRTLAAVQGKIMAAEKWGKWKMGVQSGAVLLMLVILVAIENSACAPAWLARLPYHLTVICVVFTWASAYFYYRQSRRMIESSWG